MYLTRIASSLFASSLFALLAGCSSSSSASKPAPVVKSFDAPDSVAASTFNGQNAYVLQGNLDFSDSAEDVVSFTAHVDLPSGTPFILQDTTVSLQQPTENGPVPIELGLPADPQGKQGLAPGSVTYEITMHSASGLVSDPLKKAVTLE